MQATRETALPEVLIQPRYERSNAKHCGADGDGFNGPEAHTESAYW